MVVPWLTGINAVFEVRHMIKLCYATPLLDDMHFEELEDYLSKLSAMGYKGIEPALAYGKNIDTDMLNALLKKYGITFVAARSGGILSKEKLRLSSPDKSVRKRAVELLKEQADFLEKVNGSLVIGGIQGNLLPGEDLAQAEEWVADAYREVALYAGKHGVDILFEPITRYELNYHNSTRECCGFLDRVNEGLERKVKIVFDVFHSKMEDPSVPAALIFARDRIKHIHISDTNRREPGSGTIRFAEVINVLDAIGYDGFISAEIWPKMTHLEAAKITAEYLKAILSELELAKVHNSYKF